MYAVTLLLQYSLSLLLLCCATDHLNHLSLLWPSIAHTIYVTRAILLLCLALSLLLLVVLACLVLLALLVLLLVFVDVFDVVLVLAVLRYRLSHQNTVARSLSAGKRSSLFDGTRICMAGGVSSPTWSSCRLACCSCGRKAATRDITAREEARSTLLE